MGQVAMVYIGKRQYKYGRMLMSHMAADSLTELNAMADKLGIPEKHFQNKEGKPHYDICKKNKAKALALGAIEVDDRRLIELFRSREP